MGYNTWLDGFESEVGKKYNDKVLKILLVDYPDLLDKYIDKNDSSNSPLICKEKDIPVWA